MTVFLGVLPASGQDPNGNGNGNGGDVPIFWPGGVSMRAADITEERQRRQEIQVTFAGGEIDRETLSDGDLLVVSRNGYLQEASLEKVEVVVRPPVIEPPIIEPPIIIDPVTGEPLEIDPATGLPIGLDPASADALGLPVDENGNVIWDPIVIQPPVWRTVVATYVVKPIEAEVWTEDDNGGYAVLLQRDEVAWQGGTAVPPQLLGYFDVRIGEEPPGPLLPIEAAVEIESFPTPGVPGGPNLEAYFAHVTLVYEGQGVEVDWGQVRRDGNRFVASVSARAGGGGGVRPAGVVETVEHRYDLGVLEGGEYSFVLYSANEVIARAAFKVEVEPPAPILPSEVAIDIQALPNLGPLPAFVAHVRLVYDYDRVQVRWGRLQRDGQRFIVDVEALGHQADGGPVFEPGQTVVERRFSLGMLEPGEYGFAVTSAGQVIGAEEFQAGGGSSGVPVIPDDADIRVGPLPTILIFPPPPTTWGAEVFLTFDNPQGVVIEDWGEVRREGRVFFVDVEAVRHRTAGGDGADDNGGGGIIGPPLVAFRHDYFLGELERGEYTFVVMSRGQRVGTKRFVVEGGVDPGVPEGEVELDIDASNPVTVHAGVWFKDATWMLEGPGRVRQERNVFTIDATARRIRPVEGEGEAQHFSYDLGELPPGGYLVVYKINGEVFAREDFRVEREPQPPVPIIRGIEISEGNASHFAEVSVVLPEPGLVVLDWGEVRRDGDRFLVEIVVGRSDAAGGGGADGGGDPDDPDNGIRVPVPGVPDEFPVRLVTHSYVLGVLEAGEYLFGVMHGERMIARKPFVVRRGNDDRRPPEVGVRVENVTEATEEPLQFHISYTDESGLADVDALMSQVVTVTGPNGEALVAEVLEFISTDDVPTSHATGIYAVRGPGGDWDVGDRGRYRIELSDPEGVADIHGNHLRSGLVGGFSVMIWPEPPEPPRRGEIEIGQGADGEWFAEVHLRVPEQIAARDDWDVHWGELQHRGHAFVAKVEFRRAGQGGGRDGENDGEDDREPGDERGPDDGIPGGNPFEEELRLVPPDHPGMVISHTYRLGALRPGGYLMVAISNIGHFLKEDFKVEGDVIDPGGEGGGDDGAGAGGDVIDLWRGAAFGAGDWLMHQDRTNDRANADGGALNNLLEFAAGTNPDDPSDDVEGLAQPVILEGDDGAKHLGIQFRRLIPGLDLRYRIQASRDMVNWEDVEAEIEIVEERANLDGIEEVLACLNEPVGKEGGFRWLRVVVERE